MNTQVIELGVTGLDENAGAVGDARDVEIVQLDVEAGHGDRGGAPGARAGAKDPSNAADTFNGHVAVGDGAAIVDVGAGGDLDDDATDVALATVMAAAMSWYCWPTPTARMVGAEMADPCAGECPLADPTSFGAVTARQSRVRRCPLFVAQRGLLS